jgi:hypothetical protein
VPEDENEVDLSLLLEKERSKIILQREREAQKAMDKVEAQKVKDKEARAAKKKVGEQVSQRLWLPPVLQFC